MQKQQLKYEQKELKDSNYKINQSKRKPSNNK